MKLKKRKVIKFLKWFFSGDEIIGDRNFAAILALLIVGIVAGCYIAYLIIENFNHGTVI